MLFARFEGFGTNDWLPPAFLANATLEYKYTRSLYTSLGLIAGVQDGGEPAEIGEGVFHVFVMIMSLLIFAYAIGAVASILTFFGPLFGQKMGSFLRPLFCKIAYFCTMFCKKPGQKVIQKL